VQDRFAGYDLTVLNSDDNPVPSETHSTVYFGGWHPEAFAISEQIDTMNEDHADDLIVFTQTFRGQFAQTPTFDQMATALGNTVAHELGHLLGLIHTADCNDLMDSTCTNDRLLFTQRFTTAPLDARMFPVGLQAAGEILGWVLGFVGLS
jgi:hypothetical protein